MPHEVKIHEQDRYISVRFNGMVTLPELETVFRHANNLLIANDWQHLLVEAVGPMNTISTGSHYFFTKELSQKLPVRTHIALVSEPAQQQTARFIENVSMTTGVTLQNFTDVARALQWLLGSNEP